MAEDDIGLRALSCEPLPEEVGCHHGGAADLAWLKDQCVITIYQSLDDLYLLSTGLQLARSATLINDGQTADELERILHHTDKLVTFHS